MEKTVVIYKSKYGSTKQYSKWIAEKLNCDLLEEKNVNENGLISYDKIIFGGGLYASGINGISVITKNFNKIKDKKLVVFTVGLADPDKEEQFTSILDKNFTDEMKKRIKIFHLRGGINYKTLSIVHKTMMAMLVSVMKKKKEEELSEDDKLMLQTYGTEISFIDNEKINPIVSYILEA